MCLLANGADSARRTKRNELPVKVARKAQLPQAEKPITNSHPPILSAKGQTTSEPSYNKDLQRNAFTDDRLAEIQMVFCSSLPSQRKGSRTSTAPNAPKPRQRPPEIALTSLRLYTVLGESFDASMVTQTKAFDSIVTR